MTESTFVEQALIEQLLDALLVLPQAHVELKQLEPAVHAAARVAAMIDLHVAGKSIVLLVEAKKSVYPRDVRQALWQFKSLQHGNSADVQHLLIAQALSPGAKELLRAERIGYFDSGGTQSSQWRNDTVTCGRTLDHNIETSAGFGRCAGVGPPDRGRPCDHVDGRDGAYLSPGGVATFIDFSIGCLRRMLKKLYRSRRT